MSYDAALVWFRRDLRVQDHAALHGALISSRRVYCAFVFDRDILDTLPKTDRRVDFIWHSVRELDEVLRRHGGGLMALHGKATSEIPALAQRLKVGAVFANRDYEPAAIARDTVVKLALEKAGIAFEVRKDQVIFEQDEVLTQNSRPFSVFTPYKNAWLKKLDSFYLQAYPTEKYFERLAVPPEAQLPSLESLGFARSNLLELGVVPGMSGAEKLFGDFKKRIRSYHERRDFPALKGPSYLSVHVRFGTISIRALASTASHDASRGAAVWLSELIWRDFYFMILHHYPRVVGHAFRSEYDVLKFENSREKFAAWCEARTGFPLIDAAMRQLNRTGYMHNRLRMVTASFLVKDLHVDWRWGEQYFAEHLIDFDLAANNGGWQWAASTGCDAQPYFRIFNPITQSEKFDPDGKFIRKYLPELADCADTFIHAPWRMSDEQQKKARVVIGRDYPPPAVDHDVARKTTLVLYQKIRNTE